MDELFEWHCLDVRVHRPERRQRIDELRLPAGNLFLDCGAGEIAENEPAVHRVMPDIHELELKRELDFEVVADQSAQDRFMGLDVGPQWSGFDCKGMIDREHPEVVTIAAYLHRRGILGGEPSHRPGCTDTRMPEAVAAAKNRQS